MRFIGREMELKALEDAYEKDDFQMAVIYGRRRIGKTTLLRQFCQGKKSVFFTAIKSTPKRNIDLFGKCVLNALAPEMRLTSFQSFDALCSFLGEQSKNERVIVVIDELPYMVKKDDSITSMLQKYIDEEWQFGKMFFIVCGSSVSFMEDEVLSEKSPLFGRRTMQIRRKQMRKPVQSARADDIRPYGGHASEHMHFQALILLRELAGVACFQRLDKLGRFMAQIQVFEKGIPVEAESDVGSIWFCVLAVRKPGLVKMLHIFGKLIRDIIWHGQNQKRPVGGYQDLFHSILLNTSSGCGDTGKLHSPLSTFHSFTVRTPLYISFRGSRGNNSRSGSRR